MANIDSPEEIRIGGPSKIAVLFGILLILASVAAYTFFTKSLSDDVAVTRGYLADQHDKVLELQAEIQSFEGAEDQLGLTTEVERLAAKRAIPTELNQDEVIRNLIEISKVHDITLNSLSFGKGATGKDGINSLRITAGFEGNYSDLTNFLQGLEQNARIFRVNSISVQLSNVQVGNIKRANFSLSMEAFYQG